MPESLGMLLWIGYDDWDGCDGCRCALKCAKCMCSAAQGSTKNLQAFCAPSLRSLMIGCSRGYEQYASRSKLLRMPLPICWSTSAPAPAPHTSWNTPSSNLEFALVTDVETKRHTARNRQRELMQMLLAMNLQEPVT